MEQSSIDTACCFFAWLQCRQETSSDSCPAVERYLEGPPECGPETRRQEASDRSDSSEKLARLNETWVPRLEITSGPSAPLPPSRSYNRPSQLGQRASAVSRMRKPPSASAVRRQGICSRTGSGHSGRRKEGLSGPDRSKLAPMAPKGSPNLARRCTRAGASKRTHIDRLPARPAFDQHC